MKILIFVFGFAILLNSCEKATYYNISEENMPILEDGDTLVFIDSLKNTDTFFIRKHCDHEQWDNSFEEYCYFYYDKKVNDSIEDSFFDLFIYCGRTWENEFYEHAIIYTEPCYDFKVLVSSKSPFTYVQNGYIYTDNYLLDSIYDSRCYTENNGPKILKVWYSKKHGIIRYKTKDGDDYKLKRN